MEEAEGIGIRRGGGTGPRILGKGIREGEVRVAGIDAVGIRAGKVVITRGHVENRAGDVALVGILGFEDGAGP